MKFDIVSEPACLGSLILYAGHKLMELLLVLVVFD